MEDQLYDQLEEIARSAVVAGGVAAMGYYRGALAEATACGSGANPTTQADLRATTAILQVLHSKLTPFAAELGFGQCYFAEELELTSHSAERQAAIQEMLADLGAIRPFVKTSAESFTRTATRSIAVLFDSLDGTTNFRAGIPLFCSAIAIFIHGEPRIGAIYDPLHHVVYYGSLRGLDIATDPQGKAYIWEVRSGTKVSLHERPRQVPTASLVALHLTRSAERKRSEMLDILAAVAPRFQGTYMLNSGQLALTYIAIGNLSAFVNNRTSTWDVAAGEVLVRAVGGNVTDLEGRRIRYWGHTKVGIVATANEEVHQRMLEAILATRQENGGGSRCLSP